MVGKNGLPCGRPGDLVSSYGSSEVRAPFRGARLIAQSLERARVAFRAGHQQIDLPAACENNELIGVAVT